MYTASNEDIPIRLKKVILNEYYLGLRMMKLLNLCFHQARLFVNNQLQLIPPHISSHV